MSVKLVTNVEGGMIGVGESPSSSVYVKDGITSEKPRYSANEQNQYLLNIDKGNKKPADTICFF